MAICKWCGKEYTKTHNRQMYCSKLCRENADAENGALRVRKYRKNYKEVLKGNDPLGSYGASLGPKPRMDHHKELQLVEKQLKIFRLK